MDSEKEGADAAERLHQHTCGYKVHRTQKKEARVGFKKVQGCFQTVLAITRGFLAASPSLGLGAVIFGAHVALLRSL